MNRFYKGVTFFVCAILFILSILFVSRCFADDGWTAGGVMPDRCREFAAVAGGVASLDSYQQAQVYMHLGELTEYRAGMLRDALTFVAGEKISSASMAQTLALGACTGERKNGPTLWEWVLSAGHIGPL